MNDPLVRQFLRAARQRWVAARVLLDFGMPLDAMYLAGYGPECALKALILSRMPARRRRRFMQEHFRGRIAHNVEHLVHQLRMLRITFPVEIREHIRSIGSWSVDLRYESGRGDTGETLAFLASAKAIIDWSERSV